MKNSKNERFCQVPMRFFKNSIAKATKTCYHCVKWRFSEKRSPRCRFGKLLFLQITDIFHANFIRFLAKRISEFSKTQEKSEQNANQYLQNGGNYEKIHKVFY